MTRRFRMLAGPNGSGKSTLKRRLERDYAVNFYDFLNADDIFAEVMATGAFAPRLPIEQQALVAYAASSSYDDAVKRFFLDETISVDSECVRFKSKNAVNSYTISLLTNFLQEEHIRQGSSFSQETVFSHASKVDALRRAQAAGFRTYLYFVATENVSVNLLRVSIRAAQGGHDVPVEKVKSRYQRTFAQLPAAMPYLSRAYFFDNGGEEMRYLAEWSQESGLSQVATVCPKWFQSLVDSISNQKKETAL